jgi:hypothetical protein
MTAQEFYEFKRKRGGTDNITQNDNPDYSLPFYQEIFLLMELYAAVVVPQNLIETAGHNKLTSTEIKPAMSVRLEIAKDLLAAMLSNPAFVGHTNSLPRVLRSREVLCEDALKYADELILQDSKPKK